MTKYHTHPNLCLRAMGFRYSDGGRQDYFHKHLGKAVPTDISDCAVLALSLAKYFNPRFKSPALSYRDSLYDLRDTNQRIKPWKYRNFRETFPEYIGRRIRGDYGGEENRWDSRHIAPEYGTDTNSLSASLRVSGFSLIFGEPLPRRQICLCGAPGKLVVDGTMGEVGDHAFTIIDGSIIADYDFREYYEDFHVMHVWWRR